MKLKSPAARMAFQSPLPVSPIEVSSLLTRLGHAHGVQRWYAIPALREGTAGFEEVALDLKIGVLLGDKRLTGTLRSIDFLNGCRNQCDTCLADAPLPSRAASFGSIQRLFENPLFLSMLQPDSLRFGSCGDLLDHPECISIVKLVLSATKRLDDRRLKREGLHHGVKVFTNYRPKKERLLDSLLALAEGNQERLTVVVSLPLNRTDSVNQAFLAYASARPGFFKFIEPAHADEYPAIQGSIKFGGPRVQVWDVRHPEWLLTIGRLPARHLLSRVVPAGRLQRNFRALEVGQRGLCKTYLNPDGLWLMLYATAYESHTARLYRPLTLENLGYLSAIPYHPDFPTPPHWPGGTGGLKQVSSRDLRSEASAYRRGGLTRKPPNLAIFARSFRLDG